MAGQIQLWPAVLFSLLLYQVSASDLPRDQFKDWYPEFGHVFDRILHKNCSVEYNTYLTGNINQTLIDRYRYVGADKDNVLAQSVSNCILEATSEFIKSNMAGAGVLLGLTPTILAAVGSSADETAMLFDLSRRPLLAILLAAGSPAVFPLRSFEHRDPLAILREREGRLRPPILPSYIEWLIMIFEYVLALAAISNVVSISWELGRRAICGFAPHVTYIPLLWAVLNIGIHISSAAALWLRTSVKCEQPSTSYLDIIKLHFTPLMKQKPVVVTLYPETYSFVFFSWLTPLFTVLHCLFGTLAFSSMLFISVRDSIYVISRFMVSVIVCRIILMYELAALREAVNYKPSVQVERKPRQFTGGSGKIMIHRTTIPEAVLEEGKGNMRRNPVGQGTRGRGGGGGNRRTTS